MWRLRAASILSGMPLILTLLLDGANPKGAR
jgi:hypothetical protein